MKNIRYIGKKDERTDNVAGTGLVWNGQGDVQTVSDAAAAKLLAHPDIWEDAGDAPVDEKPKAEKPVADKPADEPTPPKQDDPEDDSALAPMVNLETMDKVALKEYAQRHFGHEFHPNTGEPKMRSTIIGLMNRG